MKNPNIPAWAVPIAQFIPQDGRQRAEQQEMLRLIGLFGGALLSRDCAFAHLTASSIIVNRERTHTLMAFHRIYNSWAWTGGHCDGNGNFEAVARKEAQEETGITRLSRIGDGIASVEILPVWAHVKRGKDVGSHLHLNVSYLFEADEHAPLRIAEAENSAVGWVEIAGLDKAVTEAPMLPVYAKLLIRAGADERTFFSLG